LTLPRAIESAALAAWPAAPAMLRASQYAMPKPSSELPMNPSKGR